MFDIWVIPLLKKKEQLSKLFLTIPKTDQIASIFDLSSLLFAIWKVFGGNSHRGSFVFQVLHGGAFHSVSARLSR